MMFTKTLYLHYMGEYLGYYQVWKVTMTTFMFGDRIYFTFKTIVHSYWSLSFYLIYERVILDINRLFQYLICQ